VTGIVFCNAKYAFPAIAPLSPNWLSPQMDTYMKILTAFSLAGMLLAINHASAACTNIRDTYSGTVPANSFVIAQGPFNITSANGCRQANIQSTISAVGAGSPPKLFIDKLTGST
jgi:hypothetical protein